jgi:hypothetical protein
MIIAGETTMTVQQRRFLEGEFLTLSINGALQRSSTYATESEQDRERVRGGLRLILCDLATRYSLPVSDEEHVGNIQELVSRVGKDFAKFLDGDQLRFGVAQKAFNLYLKYLWCAGQLCRPPHCPFDDRIINGINGKEKLDLPSGCERRWTQADRPEYYRDWVSAAKKKAEKVTLSLAEWELQVWNVASPATFKRE